MCVCACPKLVERERVWEESVDEMCEKSVTLGKELGKKIGGPPRILLISQQDSLEGLEMKISHFQIFILPFKKKFLPNLVRSL